MSCHLTFSTLLCLFVQIREETDTKIELPSEGSDSDVIVITGHKAQVEAARDKILAIQNELVNIHNMYYNRQFTIMIVVQAKVM